MKNKLWLLIIGVIMLFTFTACANSASSERTSANNDQQDLSYDNFVAFTQNINTFKMDGFSIVSPTEGLRLDCAALPDTSFDTRKNDGIKGDTTKPSKYTFYFLNKGKDILIKTSFIYDDAGAKGIVYQTVTSPYSNEDLKDEYATIDRPFVDTTLISRGNYLIYIEGYLIKENQVNLSNKDKALHLIKTDVNFLKELEKFTSSEGM